MAISKVQLPLKNVAKQIRNVGSALAPRATGNLRNVLRSYNTPDRMVKFGKNGSANITFYFAPPGATYGKYWNKPYGSGRGTTATIKKRYPQHFDFAEKAYEDISVKKLIRDYAVGLGKQIALDLKEAVRAK
jgi:hypothetical protein